MAHDFSSVTETGDGDVSLAQLERMVQRYFWAREYCKDKDVLEVACGIGQGLGCLAEVAKSVQAGDITPSLVKRARFHYGDRVKIFELDAERLSFDAESFDVVILFEAIYYIPNAEKFIDECRRILRPGGMLLLATANKDLFDFNPSPYSVTYYNPPELDVMLSVYGFDSTFLGGSPVNSHSILSKLIRLVKVTAVKFNLIPGSMRSKQWLKRILFGKLSPMPKEICASDAPYISPVPIDGSHADTQNQVIYCVAKLR